MAGRGTDILLGGNPEFMAKEYLRKQNKDPDAYQIAAVGTPERTEWDQVYGRFKDETQTEHDDVVSLGGLHIAGTERHESRRIDNQLRGRSGRQGDPGSAKFFLSLQDDLLRIFGGERMQNLMLRLGMDEDVPIESKMITKRIAAAQKAVEAQNFAARKHLLEYDDVMDKQRKAVYGIRRNLLEGEDMKERFLEIIRGILVSYLDIRCPDNGHPTGWDLTGLQSDVLTEFGIKITPSDLASLSRVEIEDFIYDQLVKRYNEKEAMVGYDIMRDAERTIMLSVIDNQWKDHLLSMDHLKEGIGLRGYGQHDPLVEYKRESFDMFEAMMQRFQEETARYLYLMQILERPAESAPALAPGTGSDGNGSQRPRNVATSVDELEESFQRKKRRELDQARMAGSGDSQPVQQVVRGSAKVGRNDPCPCGSGKKYKKCCGAQVSS
jgi:preprotein translocase subunit SecA